MIRFIIEKRFLTLIDDNGILDSSQKGELFYRGGLNPATTTGQGRYIAENTNPREILSEILPYLEEQGVPVELDDTLQKILSQIRDAEAEIQRNTQIGTEIKDGLFSRNLDREFLKFARGLPRPLLAHQEKAAIHLLHVRHAANFSVPGAGKSAVVLSVFAWLRKKKKIRSLFVVGPRSCFAPWKNEYQATLGKEPKVQIIPGEKEERKLKYYPTSDDICDLYLTTYNTLSRDVEDVLALFEHASNDVFFVMDEAHYIKQQEGTWANAVLEAAKGAKRRCVLTGTPFPKSYSDGINIFEALYPDTSPFSAHEKERIRRNSRNEEHEAAKRSIEPVIAPLFYRVRKTDLGLSTPQFLDPIFIPMNPLERVLYDTIVERVRELERDEINRDFPTIQRLQRGRIIRLRQVLSYGALLCTAIDDYQEDLLGNHLALAHKIAHYDQLETPGKIRVLLEEIAKLRQQGEKVVVWSNFIKTLDRIQECCKAKGWKGKIICGATPVNEDSENDTRDKIIEEFKSQESGLDVLIANPAACAESISLHKTCSNAIYYDLSFNCAEYLQSLDRIHRVGGSETKKSYYRYLQYDDTIEHRILENLLGKASRMADLIDGDFPFCFTNLEENDATDYAKFIK